MPKEMKQAIVIHDNLDDRKEIYHLLHRLKPYRRLQFLQWACSIATGKRAKGLKPQVKQKTFDMLPLAMKNDSWDERLSMECYIDLWHLSMNYALDFNRVLARLVEVAKHG